MDATPFETALTFLRVRDLAATRDFYCRDLALRLERDQGACVILAAGSAYVGFCHHDPQGGGVPGFETSDDVILTFVTTQVDDWYGRLRRLGIEIEGPPRRHPEIDIYHFFARDPDGYRIEIQRFDDPLR